jgi:hypothetical protein
MSNDTLGREKRDPRPKWWPKMSHCRDRAKVAYRAAENMARRWRDRKAPRDGGREEYPRRNAVERGSNAPRARLPKKGAGSLAHRSQGAETVRRRERRASKGTSTAWGKCNRFTQ